MKTRAERDAIAGLVASLRGHAQRLEEKGLFTGTVTTHIAQAATMIETLADQIDFAVPDRMADAVVDAVRESLHDEEGWHPRVGPVTVDNGGFSGWIEEGNPEGYIWRFTFHREEKNASQTHASIDPA